jgi:hypothetical protein
MKIKLLALLMLSASFAVAPSFAADTKAADTKSSTSSMSSDKGTADKSKAAGTTTSTPSGSMAAPSGTTSSMEKGAASGSMASDKGTTEKSANSQQNKMKECQAQAGEKKLEGSKRQDYVNNCLKAKPAADTKAMSNSEKMSMCNKKTAGLKGDEKKKVQSDCMKGA